MEQGQELIDPNLNAESYRNLALTDQPPIHDKQLEVVIVYRDDSLIVGASNMVDRYWYGTLWYYNELVNFDRNNYTAALRTESGVCDAVFLGQHNRFVIGQDNGVVQIYEVIKKKDTQVNELQYTGCSCYHDDSVTSVTTFHNNTHVVSGGMDCSIKIWDTTEMTVTSSFNQAHTNFISSIAVQTESDSVFISTSLDSEVLLWDIRDAKPAQGLWKNEDCGLTAASWKCNDQNIVTIGGEDGSISILDIRNISSDPIYKFIQFPRSVRRLVFNPDNPTQLAGCCDSTEVKVFSVNDDKVKVIHENSAHSDFVRGLTWHNNDLITCSWDNRILRHSVMSESVE